MSGLAKRRSVVSRGAPLALLPAGAFVVHQLRYWLAYGSHAGAMLERQGHAYLHSVVPWLVLLLALAAGIFLRALGRAFAGQSSVQRYTISFAVLWLACTTALIALYVSQELLEGLVATGHPAGLAGVLGFGGWWSIPASACVGLVLAALLHGARWVLRTTARRHTRAIPPAPRRRARTGPPRAALLPRPAPVAAGWSGRGPPR
jgi:hypothetical protein